MLDTAASYSGRSRGQTFEDFLEIVVCTLSGGQMEEQYLKVVERYAAGQKGKRGIDILAQMFGELVNVMEETRADILGDLFMGAITFGERGQFFTPDSLCRMMAQMQLTPEDHGKRIFDPAAGSGRTLLAAAEISPNNEFYGQDIDLRCVRMTAINLGLRNLYGYAIWGNSLENEQLLVYRTGLNINGGVIRELPVAERPKPLPTIPAPASPTTNGTHRQLTLFDMDG